MTRWIGLLAAAHCALCLFVMSAAQAGTYGGIGAMDTLGDIKRRFPSANFERLNPAWAQASDVMYSVTGRGLSGSIVVKFVDFRPNYRDELAQAGGAHSEEIGLSGDYANDSPDQARRRAAYEKMQAGEANRLGCNVYHCKANETPNQARLRGLAEGSDDSSLVVEWVRWIPDHPIPLQRFVVRFGHPTKSDFAKEDLQPYRDWAAQGLTAYLDDSEKTVVRVDYTFTDEEQCQAGIEWTAKLGIPAPPCVDRFPKLKQQK